MSKLARTMPSGRCIVWTVVLMSGLLLAACAPEATPTTVPEPDTPSSPSSLAPSATLTPSSPEIAPTAPELTRPTLQPTATDEDTFAAEREAMVKDGVIGWGIEDEAVIEAMRAVPRHKFVPEEFLSLAYQNHPLPIGYGQTISQPYIVALMTQAADVGGGDKVLEVGTGSGYQAAVLAELVDRVLSIEIIEPLAVRAEAVLADQGYDNVSVRHADGYFGWEEEAPFDAIVVTAAPDHVPQPLVQQLKIGGRLIIPVGPVGGFQNLWLITRVSEEEVMTQDLGGVSFVPLTREMR